MLQPVPVDLEAAPRSHLRAIDIQSTLKVLECDISSTNGSGIDIKPEAKSVEISKCYIHDCGVCGIQMAGEARCHIHHNHLERNMDGVLLWRTGRGEAGAIEVYENKVTGNKGSGIGVHSQSNANVLNNEVRAIELRNASDSLTLTLSTQNFLEALFDQFLLLLLSLTLTTDSYY